MNTPGTKILKRTTRAHRHRGITGLETAIILIAFVVVAAVFAFTVLSAGIFSSERSKETVYAGLRETTSTLEPKGGMVAIRGSVDGTNAVVQVKFAVAGSVSAELVDLTPPYTLNDTGTDPDASGLAARTVIGYTDSRQHINEAKWTVEFVGGNNGDYLLDKDELAEITVWLHEKTTLTGNYALGTGLDGHLSTRLGVNTKFSIMLNSDQGGFFAMERSVPPRLNAVMDLR
jgi:flagellin FlaB